MISFSKCLVLFATVTSVLAQDDHHGFSQQCQQALAQLANNADASKCLAIPQIPPIFASPDASVVKPVDTWLNAMCAAQPCSDQTISTVVTTFVQGCPEEVKYWGIKDTASAVQTVQKFYPPFRKAFCLKRNNNLCATETLTNYEKSVGTLTYTKLGQFYEADTTSLPTSVVCTDCNKAVYNVFTQAFGPGSDEASKFKQLCGDSFVDGKNPSGISGL